MFEFNLIVCFFFQSISDEQYIVYTPYDDPGDSNVTNTPKKEDHQNAAVQQLPENRPNLTDKKLTHNFSDENWLTAAAQLVDVVNKHPTATIILQKKPEPTNRNLTERNRNLIEPNRNRNLIESHDHSLTEPKDADLTEQKNRVLNESRDRNLTESKHRDLIEPRNRSLIESRDRNPTEPRDRHVNMNQSLPRIKYRVPKFVVTKITEKNQNDVARDSKSEKVVWSSGSSKIKALNELPKLKLNPKPMNEVEIFQKSNQARPVFEAKEFRIKNMSISNKPTVNSERTPIKPRSLDVSESKNNQCQNEPVILNFRTKLNGSLSKTKPTTPLNGKFNTPYLSIESASSSKNSLEIDIISPKTIDRYYVNKTQLNSLNKPPKSTYSPKVYSRFPATNPPQTVCHKPVKTVRAPLVKLWPSMTELDANNRSYHIQPHGMESTLKRHNSAIVLGSNSSEKLFDKMLKNDKEYYRLYDLCSNVVIRLRERGQAVRRKRGRPKKKIYQNHTKELLCSPDFSIKADILRLNDPTCQSTLNSRRSRRFALLSIEPILPDIEMVFNKNQDKERERSPLSTFQINRATLKTYSRANIAQSRAIADSKRIENSDYDVKKSQIQLLNIEPLPSTSKNDSQETIHNEVTQSTEYIIGPEFDLDDFNDDCDVLCIEYLDENDEIESPAYEPLTTETETKHSLIITEEADTTFHTKLEDESIEEIDWNPFQSENTLDMAQNPTTTTSSSLEDVKKSQHIEIRYLKASESDAHSTTDSMSELFSVYNQNMATNLGRTTFLPSKKPIINISPVRKSTRKRKIPSEFPNFAKKVRS